MDDNMKPFFLPVMLIIFEATIIKIAVPTKIGRINFCPLYLNQSSVNIIKKSVKSLLVEL